MQEIFQRYVSHAWRRLGRVSIIALMVLFFAGVATAAEAGKNVLFIGNSFTYYNNGLHNHFNQFVRAADIGGDKSPKVRIMTISGARLSQHAPALVPMLEGTDWDIVVLQGHSYETINRKSREHFARAVRAFDKKITESGAETALFMTWAYTDRPEMTAIIDRAYSALGSVTKATVVPVGLAFERAREAQLDIRLVSGDKKHPRVAGTYLAAATFFASLYEASPVELDYVPRGVGKDQAKILREIAWQTVVDYNKRREK